MEDCWLRNAETRSPLEGALEGSSSPLRISLKDERDRIDIAKKIVVEVNEAGRETQDQLRCGHRTASDAPRCA
jgi:hypothetical protein